MASEYGGDSILIESQWNLNDIAATFDIDFSNINRITVEFKYRS